jgi:multidrug transporter EmrE-like cation transporter
MHPFVLALVSVAMSVAAQFFLKSGMSHASTQAAMAQGLGLQSAWTVFTQPYVLAGFALYGLGAVVWLSVLSAWDVSKAYPLVGMGFALTVLIGFLLGEQVTLARVAGVLLICSGVALVARS